MKAYLRSQWERTYLRFIALIFSIALFLFFFRANSVDVFLREGASGTIYSFYASISLFVKENTKDFFVFLAAAIFMEILKGKVFSNTRTELEEVAQIIGQEIDCLDVNRAISKSFSAKNDTNSNFDIKSLLFNKPVYKDVNVSIVLEDKENCDPYFIYTSDITFQAKSENMEEIVFGIARSPAIQDRLSNCEKINDVIVSGFDLSDKTKLNPLVQSLGVSFITRTLNGAEEERRTPHIVLPGKVYRYIKNSIDVYEKDYLLVSFGAIDPTAKSISISVKNLYANKNDQYIYWMADRPMFVNEINIDASRLTFHGKPHLILSPKILGFKSHDQMIKISDGKYKLRIFEWLTYGQGVTLSWKKKTHAVEAIN